jgi:hypothetical protein
MLLDSLRPAQKKALRSVPSADLSERTWNLAAWVRNEFGLWSGSSPLCCQRLYLTGDDDKDLTAGLDRPLPGDVSAAIVRAAWERLQQEAE